MALGKTGEPLDVLLLMDEAAFPCCIVEGRVVGVIEVEQEDMQYIPTSGWFASPRAQ